MQEKQLRVPRNFPKVGDCVKIKYKAGPLSQVRVSRKRVGRVVYTKDLKIIVFSDFGAVLFMGIDKVWQYIPNFDPKWEDISQAISEFAMVFLPIEKIAVYQEKETVFYDKEEE